MIKNFKIPNVVFKIREDDISETEGVCAIGGRWVDKSTDDFFKHYSDREPYQELPLLQSDGIVIPNQCLRKALSNPKYLKDIPIIAGSTRD